MLKIRGAGEMEGARTALVVTRGTAEKEFGVVLKPDVSIDSSATAELRRSTARV